MTLKTTRLLLAATAMIFSAGQVAAKSDAVDNGFYTAKDKEFYLTADEIFFIRPGLEAEIVKFEIPADLQPEVTFTVKDPGGLALDLDGVTTPGPVEMRYYLTFVGDDGQKDIFDWGNRDRTGVLTDLGNGMHHYKFGNALPADYDMDATYTFGLRARRDLREWDLGRYVVNEMYDFVPSGASKPMPRKVVTTETCNGRCHDPLAEHGGGYVEVDMCTQCHNPNYMALRGEEARDHARFDVLVHALHAEAHSYPTAISECQVCHTGGTPTENFPLVASPNPVPVCDGSGAGQTTLMWDFPATYEIRLGAPDGKLFAKVGGKGSAPTGKWTKDGQEFFVVDPATGDTMQQLGVDNTTAGCINHAAYSSYGVAGLQHTNWMDHPSRLVCGSCHTDIDFETGEGHSDYNFPVDNDEICVACHRAYTGKEFDRSVWGAHVPVLSSSQLPGLFVEFLEVTDTDPGDMPTVKFRVADKYGPVNPNEMDRIRFAIWGPNEDFDRGDSFNDDMENVAGNAVNMGGGIWSYTMTTALPADAKGSYSIGVEGRNDVPIDFGGGEVDDEHDTIEGYVYAFAVTDDEAMARRMVVDDAKCEACHNNLVGHGNNRRDANYCITCHRPERLDIADPAENVSLKWMLHKIHSGAELENGYVVVRSRGTYDFSEIEFPGDLRNCEKCHVNDSYKLPLPEGLLATLTPNQFWNPTGPAAAACLSCHDSTDAQAHAYSNTTFFGESCSACHGDGASYDVEKVHAR